MLHRVALVRTDVSEELSASIIRVTRIDELGTTLAIGTTLHTAMWFGLLVTAKVPSSLFLFTLKMDATCSSEVSVLTIHRALHRRRRLSSKYLFLYAVGVISHVCSGLGGRKSNIILAFSCFCNNTEQINGLRELQSASELNRLSDRHLSAKFSANFCG
jgi:hypothetical protein